MRPAMNTERRGSTSRPLSPTPTPPGLTSPSFMCTSGTMPPAGVKLSCMQLTEPLDVPVVDAAHRPHALGPVRTSFPSALPPGELAVTDCLTPTPRAYSFGVTPTSR